MKSVQPTHSPASRSNVWRLQVAAPVAQVVNEEEKKIGLGASRSESGGIRTSLHPWSCPRAASHRGAWLPNERLRWNRNGRINPSAAEQKQVEGKAAYKNQVTTALWAVTIDLTVKI